MSDLRDVAEALKAQSKSITRIESDISYSTRALEELSVAMTIVVRAIESMEGIPESISAIEKSLRSLPQIISTLGTLTSEVVSLGTRLNTYVDATAKQNGMLRSRLTKLEQIVAQR